MATKRIDHAIDVEDIYCVVTCPECEKTVRMHIKKPVTRKNCPGCNRVTFMFTISQLRGYIVVNALTVGSDFAPNEYELLPSDIEIEGEK